MMFEMPRIDAQRVKQARETILRKGWLPSGILRDEIQSSWVRCLDRGMSFDQQLALDVVSAAQLERRQERNRELISSSLPEMEGLYRHFGCADSMVMLADADAMVIKQLGQPVGDDKSLYPSFELGVCWQEHLGGTNALGTVIEQGKPLLIHGKEHYIDAISGFSCSAAPIYDPSGQVAGVLDVTSKAELSRCHNLGLVMLSSRLIENRLFIDRYRDQVIVAVHPRPEFVDSSWQGLLAFNEEGGVLAMDREARACLAAKQSPGEQSNCAALLGVGLGPLLDQLSHRRQPLALRQAAVSPLYLRLLHQPSNHKPKAAATRNRSAADEQALTLSELVMDDALFERAAKRGVKALNHQLPLLLSGETGSGKDALAKVLHQQSDRAEAPFVAVNCAAIPEGLIESELFGYQEGAFTGARRGGAQGKFQQAHKGTLFLDEIGDMPLDMQARLLRVLQERQLTPLGSNKEIDVDINVICATHRDLKTMVAEGRFREDLYYRLNGVSISIPALRQRRNLGAFAEQLLNRQAGEQKLRIASALKTRFQRYDWPGNVRQLQTVIRTALAFREPDDILIEEHHLSDDFLLEMASPIQTGKARGPADGSNDQTLKTAQIDLIKQAIEAYGGNISAAAQSLGISRTTLYRQLQNAGIKLAGGKQLIDPQENDKTN